MRSPSLVVRLLVGTRPCRREGSALWCLCGDFSLAEVSTSSSAAPIRAARGDLEPVRPLEDIWRLPKPASRGLANPNVFLHVRYKVRPLRATARSIPSGAERAM